MAPRASERQREAAVTPARGARRPLPAAVEAESPPFGRGPAAGPAGRIEPLRRAIGRARARIRALQTRAAAGPLPPPAVARLGALRAEVEGLRRDLLRAIREAVPDDPAPPRATAAGRPD
jgi:hypothetical protein